jgi:hypothetical protein
LPAAIGQGAQLDQRQIVQSARLGGVDAPPIPHFLTQTIYCLIRHHPVNVTELVIEILLKTDVLDFAGAAALYERARKGPNES